MQNFIYNMPTKIFFGQGSIDNLPEALNETGTKKVLVLYGGGSIKKNGVYEDVINQLKKSDVEYFEMSGIRPNPVVEDVLRATDICRKNDIDLVLAVGGGSVIDSAKAIAAYTPYDGDIMDVLTNKVRINPLKVASVLTLAATGSEMNAISVISAGANHKKFALINQKLFPVFSILDPSFTTSVNRHHTAAGAADIISHCMEQYFHPETGMEVQDGMNEGIIRAIIKYGPIAVNEPGNLAARSAIMWGATMAFAGYQLLLGKPNPSFPIHTLAHELSSMYDMTHGLSLALITPAWMKYTMEKSPDYIYVFANFARNVFGININDENKAASRGIKELRIFYDQLGIPAGLKEAGVNEDDIEILAKRATESRKPGALALIDYNAALQIFKNSL